jgi:hypothetical protein
MPKQVPHAFFSQTDEVGEIIVVYTPGGGQKSTKSSVRRRAAA